MREGMLHDDKIAERIREEADRYVARKLLGAAAAGPAVGSFAGADGRAFGSAADGGASAPGSFADTDGRAFGPAADGAPAPRTSADAVPPAFELSAAAGARLARTVSAAKGAYRAAEASRPLTRFEFLAQQSRYIRKRWWALQAVLLAVVGWTLLASGDSAYAARCLGTVGPAFAVLILPELWKNRSSGSMEIEGAAYYSLRQIYAARMTLFAMTDLALLSVFIGVTTAVAGIPLTDLAVQFLLPFTVTCGICFTTFYDRHFHSEGAALLPCVCWVLIWIRIVLDGGLYETIAHPVWYGMLALSAAYLVFCVLRGQRNLRQQWEEEPVWN